MAGILRANIFTRVNLILFALWCCVLLTGRLEQGLFALLIVFNSVIGFSAFLATITYSLPIFNI